MATASKSRMARTVSRKAVKPRLKNYVCIAIDSSGSMDHLRQQVVDTFNNLVRTAHANDQDTYISLVTFDGTATLKLMPAQAGNVREIGLGDYRPNGWTALWDGTGLAIETLEGMADADAPNVSHLVIVITDGGENQSRKYNASRLNDKIARLHETDRWTITFQVPPGMGVRFANQFGIPQGNVCEWEATQKGWAESEEKTSGGLTNFFGARSAGLCSVKNFYAPVTTDLSAAANAIKRQLVDVSSRYKVWTVGKESSVKDFVELKTRKPYVIGSTFYQLMKKEKIQPAKQILVAEKIGTKVFGGADAREVIGLPIDGKTHAQVTPGNHADYDVFVQSTSVNRILPRGTKVLFDTLRTTSLPPTWEATKKVA